jgi:hypothetical protein
MSTVFKKYVLEFGENVFSCDESVLFCKLCETKVNAERRYTVTHHIETAKHQRAVNRQSTTKTSITQGNNIYKKNHHFLKTCVRPCYPPIFRCIKSITQNFIYFCKHIRIDIPNESTLRRNYVNEVYSDTLNKKRDNIKGNKIWVSN